MRLPQDLKDALFSMEAADTIGKLRIKYNLNEKGSLLADETGLVMLGILHPRDFISDLAEKLGVDRETAKKIADDVNQQIFQKVRISLRKIYGISDQEPITKETVQVKPSVPAPPPAPIIKIAEDVASKIPAPKPPMPPRPPVPPPQASNLPPVLRVPPSAPPRETPKEELRPLEIRPLKSPFDSGKPFTPKVPPASNASPARNAAHIAAGGRSDADGPTIPVAPKPIAVTAKPEGVSHAPPPPEKLVPKIEPKNLEKDHGLLVMPQSPPSKEKEKEKEKNFGAPPPGMAFLDKKIEKKINDPYRENI